MRKLFSFMMATADGYYEGANQEFDWPNVDKEFEEFAIAQLDEVGTLVFGRVTYQMMASYWPTPTAAEQNDARIVERMNNISKIVASRTLEEAGWTNTRLVEDITDELGRLKSEPGKDIAVFGSSNLTATLLRTGLVDELRIMVNPVLLGDGNSLFNGTDETISLKLLDSRRFDSGNILLVYQPAKS